MAVIEAKEVGMSVSGVQQQCALARAGGAPAGAQRADDGRAVLQGAGRSKKGDGERNHSVFWFLFSLSRKPACTRTRVWCVAVLTYIFSLSWFLSSVFLLVHLWSVVPGRRAGSGRHARHGDWSLPDR